MAGEKRDTPQPSYVWPRSFLQFAKADKSPSVVFIETSCGYSGSLTPEDPLRVSMNLMQGFCVEFQDQVSGMYGAVTEVLLPFGVFVCNP